MTVASLRLWVVVILLISALVVAAVRLLIVKCNVYCFVVMILD
jgi:hypothetical protein